MSAPSNPPLFAPSCDNPASMVTLRDLFAAFASGPLMMSVTELLKLVGSLDGAMPDHATVARGAYEIADAMLAAREAKPT